MISAPRIIPEHFINDFTMGGVIPIYDWYFDETVQTNVIWDDDMMAEYHEKFTKENIIKSQYGIPLDGYTASHMVLDALNKIENIEDKDVCIVGSQTPWIEFICLLKKVKSITTVEYNPPLCNHHGLKIISYDEFVNSDMNYDIIISYSSIEHSGLGRYGDEIDPNGDLKAMNEIRKHLLKDGILLLGIPVGKDAVTWNAHRIYGKIRLPLLLENFVEIEWLGTNKSYLDTCSPHNNGPNPLIVLEHKKT